MKLLNYVKKYKVSATIGFVFKILEAILELCVPIVMADIIDQGIKTGNREYIYQRGVILIGLGIVGYLFALVCQYYASKNSQSIGTAIRKDMYHKINTFTYRDLDTYPTSTLVTRMSADIVQIQLAIAMTIRLTSRAPFLIIGSLVMAFFVSPSLSFIFIVGAIVLAIVIIGITVLSMPYFHRIQKIMDNITKVARENLQGIRVIRAFSRQDKEKERFAKETKAQQVTQIKVGKLQALSNPLTYSIVNLAIILIVYQGGLQVQIGSLSQGEIIALVNYMNQILLALIVFTNVLTIYNKASASYRRIQEVFAVATDVQEREKTSTWDNQKPTLQMHNVSFSYTGENVLHNISLELAMGQTLGIIGGTGAGKSTVIQLLGRFYEIQDGTIYINGKNSRDIPKKQLRQWIGYVPQKTALISGTIRENLKMGNQEATDEELYQALSIAQAKEFIDGLPEGLDTKIVQGGKNVSGGQRQRLTIARALVKKPKILILDNSDSALDNMTSVALKKALVKLKNMSIIILSQRTYALEHANQILVLSHGEAVGYGTHQELLKNCSIYQEIYDSQRETEGQ